MSEPMPFAKIRLSLMFAAEHELPIELGTDEVWSVLNKLDQLSAETGKAIVRAEAAERENKRLRDALQRIVNSLEENDDDLPAYGIAAYALESAVRFAEKCDREVDKLRAERDQLTAELAALKDRTEGVCKWSLEDDDYNIWKGDCGTTWNLEYDDPVTNGMNYCPKCGKHLEQIDPEPPEVE